MKQIYDFDLREPPLLNERSLRQKLEKRRLHFQTALLALSAVLIQGALLLLARIASSSYPLVAALCLGHVLTSAAGSGVIALIYTHKGGRSHG